MKAKILKNLKQFKKDYVYYSPKSNKLFICIKKYEPNRTKRFDVKYPWLENRDESIIGGLKISGVIYVYKSQSLRYNLLVEIGKL